MTPCLILKSAGLNFNPTKEKRTGKKDKQSMKKIEASDSNFYEFHSSDKCQNGNPSLHANSTRKEE